MGSIYAIIKNVTEEHRVIVVTSDGINGVPYLFAPNGEMTVPLTKELLIRVTPAMVNITNAEPILETDIGELECLTT